MFGGERLEEKDYWKQGDRLMGGGVGGKGWG